jgi:hypothetical protein
MTTVQDIEKAVANLNPRELDRFRVWFEEFQAVRFEAVIERDVRSGKLDRLAEEAIAEYRRGDAREL